MAVHIVAIILVSVTSCKMSRYGSLININLSGLADVVRTQVKE